MPTTTKPARHRASLEQLTSPDVRVTVNHRATATALVGFGAGVAAGVLIASSLLVGAVTEAQRSRDLSVMRSEVVASTLAEALATRCTADEQHDCWWVRTGTDQILVDVAGNVYPLTAEG